MGGGSSSSTGGGGAGGGMGGAGGMGGGMGGMGGMGGVGGVGGSPTENCLDGIDNDGDNNPDCADSDCGNFECVDEAPNGWEGYFRIHTMPYPNNPPSMCPDGSAPTSYYDTPNPGDCSACSCGAWENASCTPPPITCYNQSNTCMGNQMLDLSQFVPDGTCFNVPGIGMSPPRSCALTGDPAVADMGSCQPSGGDLMFPEPWMNQDDVCGQPIAGAGCGNKQVCVPKGGGDYNGPVCIRKMGMDVCPPDYQNLVEVATGGTDDRTCNACQCAVSGVTCSGGEYTIYDQDNCAGANVTVNSMNCVDVTQHLDGNSGAIDTTMMPTAAGGTCAESGGEPMGSVTPDATVTFCCK